MVAWLRHAEAPRWSRSDPNVLYFVTGNQLKQYNVATNAISVVHTFAEYSGITGKGKSDISFDGDHFVLVGDNEYVFVYEISTDSEGPAFDTAGTPFNAVFITPDNNVMITWYGPHPRNAEEKVNKLPAKYGDPSTPAIKATVKEGNNELEPFRLK